MLDREIERHGGETTGAPGYSYGGEEQHADKCDGPCCDGGMIDDRPWTLFLHGSPQIFTVREAPTAGMAAGTRYNPWGF